MAPKKRNWLVTCLALLGLGFLALCAAGIFINVLYAPTAPPAPAAVKLVRVGEARKDLGVQSASLGSQNQARELLRLIEAQPGRVDYQITYQNEIDTVLFGCNFEKGVIVRVHQNPDGTGKQEIWSGHIMERLNTTANGTGSLNDTPEGKIFAEETYF